MKKIVKLTESDLYNIIRKTLSEDAPEPVPSTTETARSAKFLFDENKTKLDPKTTELAKKFLRDGIKSSIPTIRRFHNDPQFKMPPVVTFHVGTSSTGDFKTNKSVAEKRMSYLTDIYLDIMNSFGVRDDVAYKLLVQSNKSYTPSKIDRDFYDPAKVGPKSNERIATIVVRPITTQGRNIEDIGRISGGLIDAASSVNTWLYDNVDEKGILQGIKQLQTYSDIKDLDRTLIDARMGSLQGYLNRELSNYPEIKRQIVGHLNQIAKRSSKASIANLVGNTLSIILENKKVVKLTESELVKLINKVVSKR